MNHVGVQQPFWKETHTHTHRERERERGRERERERERDDVKGDNGWRRNSYLIDASGRGC
jgi:hypothetical protein